MERMSWDDICRCERYRGRWVALARCHYDESSGKATEASVVDADDDLQQLCTRMRSCDQRNCEIRYAEAG
jgi:hypothetical protein